MPTRLRQVEDTHAVVYKALGAWVRDCYGSPLAMTSGTGASFQVGRGRWRHLHTPLSVFYGESRMGYTGVHDNGIPPPQLLMALPGQAARGGRL